MSRRRHAGTPSTRPATAPASASMIAPAVDGETDSASRDLAHAHDAGWLDRAHDQWGRGDYPALAALQIEAAADHPERAALMLSSAAACLLIGESQLARQRASQALRWGCDPRAVARLLLAATHHTLGRAALFANRAGAAERHFELAVPQARSTAEQRRWSGARLESARADLDEAVRSQRAQRRAAGGEADPVPSWISNLATLSLQAEDVHESVDQVLEQSLAIPGDKAEFLMLVAERFRELKDPATAQHFLHCARDILAPEPMSDVHVRLARLLALCGHPGSAMDLLASRALAAALPGDSNAALVQSLAKAYDDARQAQLQTQQHGHELLLQHLRSQLPTLQSSVTGRRLVFVEIGTTRENLPGQGSTRKLAEYCLRHDLQFITVDMDPHNSAVARKQFAELGASHFQAVTMKGEDYLREYAGEFDIVFLDAFDFDHGKHGALRQSRYQKMMGVSIDNAGCHQMHLECAESVSAKLSAHGVVCIDDTWIEAGQWTAKGKLAVPYLLANGFQLLEAGNNAALLNRRHG